MKNNINHPQTNFWFGFAFGVTLAGSISFLLGTKRGRELLKQILEISEDIGEDITPLIKRVSEEISTSIDEISNEVKSTSTQTNTIGSVLQRIKILSPRNEDKTRN